MYISVPGRFKTLDQRGHLQDMYKSRSPLYDEEDSVAKRMEAVSALGRLLQQTSSEADTGAPTQWQLYRQVYSPACCCRFHHLYSSMGFDYVEDVKGHFVTPSTSSQER